MAPGAKRSGALSCAICMPSPLPPAVRLKPLYLVPERYFGTKCTRAFENLQSGVAPREAARPRSACSECEKKTRPVEPVAGIGLAPGSEVAVRSDLAQRQRRTQRAHESRELRILRIGERALRRSLQLDADRKVVAALPSAPARDTRVPGAPLHGDELDQLAVPTHQEMRRHAQVLQLAEGRMRSRVEPVGEQFLDRVAAEFPGRQADRMHHEERRLGTGGTIVAVRRRNLSCVAMQPVRAEEPQAPGPPAAGSRIPRRCMR